LLAYRELDDALGLTAMAAEIVADACTGRNGRHALVGMLRQSVFGRLAGYEDVNDAERLRHDPAMRWIVGGKAASGCAASPSQMGRFETQWLAIGEEPIRPHRSFWRPPNQVRRHYANFTYQAGSWTKPLRVVAKFEWHPGELYPRVGFIVTNMARSAENVVAFYNKRGTCEQWFKEGKGAIKWTRLPCRPFAATRRGSSFMRSPIGNFLRTLATPEPIKIPWEVDSDRPYGRVR
jgi:Transposase DDE domain group 1